MYKNCQTEYSAARQRRVEEQLLKELEQRHYEDISVSDLCKSTGISRKSFYRYFSGKQGVLEALLDHTILQGDVIYSSAHLKNPSEELTVFFQFWRENRFLLETLKRSALLDMLVNRAVLLYQESYVHQHAVSTPEDACMASYRIEFLISGLMRMMLRWYQDGFPLTEVQMAAAAKMFSIIFS